MSHHIARIHIGDKRFERYTVAATPTWLGPLSKINVFVGVNNSGKSRFLRTLASIKQLRFETPYDFKPFENIQRTLKEGIAGVCTSHNCRDVSGFKHRIDTLSLTRQLNESEPILHELISIASDMAAATQFVVTDRGGSNQTHGVRDPRLSGPLNRLGQEASQGISKTLSALQPKYDFHKVYIPTLRGLRALRGNEDPYAKRTVSDYFPKAEHLKIFTGLTLYEDLRKLLLGDLDDRETVAQFQSFLSEAFFENAPVALIPRHDSDVLDVKIGEETQRPIYSLGDGIQSLIILTFPVFQYRSANLLLFIEEPELFLHPGMQRLLLNILLRPTFENAQYFVTTHSNHLLDLTLDIEKMSVFTFNKKLSEGIAREKDVDVAIENVSNEDKRTLQLIGVQNSAVFLSNCTIWVEGITDRRYLLHYLRIYQEFLRETDSSVKGVKEVKHDLHYSFVEYAGSNITHWSFLNEINDAIVVERLCGRLFLVTDRDAAKGAKKERHLKLREHLGTRYYCLVCREIENLIAPPVLLKVISTYEEAEVIHPKLRYEHYNSAPLGKFIEKRLLKGIKRRKGSYMSDSGTITNKAEFCHRALSFITHWNDMSAEAQVLTKKIYSFIIDHNP